MARIAHGPSAFGIKGGATGVIPGGDDYLAKVVKLIPAEVVATYSAVFNLIGTLPVSWRVAGYWTNVAIFWLATPLVLLLIGKKEGKLPSNTHLIISTIAFGVWAYAISGGIVLGPPGFQPALAGIVMLLFTFISGLIPLP